MKRIAVGLLLSLAACSKGDPIIPAAFRGPVAVVAAQFKNSAVPTTGLYPYLVVASVRGNDLKVVDPFNDQPVAGPNLAWSVSIPTVQRPTFLGSMPLGDGRSDLLVVASSGTQIQIIGTWLESAAGFGVAATWDLADPQWGLASARGAQILSLAVMPVPTGPPVGDPAIAPVATGRAWIVAALSDPTDITKGQLAVIEVARAAGGDAIGMDQPPVVKPLSFTPNAIATAPDNVHLYAATTDPITDDVDQFSGRGVAQIDASAGLTAKWPVRLLASGGVGTSTVATAFVGERTPANFYTFAVPALRVYATLDPKECGSIDAVTKRPMLPCGVATFDPSRLGLAADPAILGPPVPGGGQDPDILTWSVPVQDERAPIYAPALTTATGIAMPAQYPGPNPPGADLGSQVCFSPADPTGLLPLCPAVSVVGGSPPFNGQGAPQSFMFEQTTAQYLWTSVVGLFTTIDGMAYLQDLGRFGPVNSVDMLGADSTRTKGFGSTLLSPAGPTQNSSAFGFPPGTAGLGLWSGVVSGVVSAVVTTGSLMDASLVVWPGYTRDDHWILSYQGMLPGLGQRRAVLGLTVDPLDGVTPKLYLAIQEAAVAAPSGVLDASGYWIPGAILDLPESRADLGIRARTVFGSPGDLALFQLDNDPCPSTRPNWIPAGGVAPVYDPTQPPQPHETEILDFVPEPPLAPRPDLYPGGAMILEPIGTGDLATEYQCLVDWFQTSGNQTKVLTAANNIPASGDYARGAWVRASGLLLVGLVAGYAGRPVLDKPYALAWDNDPTMGLESAYLADKARRFYYPAAYQAPTSQNYPGMTDPMQTGPALWFRAGRYCPNATCNPTSSPLARDAGIDFYTQSGVVLVGRHPANAVVGNNVTTFDKSGYPGQEYRGRVFYVTFSGNVLMMYPPGYDASQTLYIR